MTSKIEGRATQVIAAGGNRDELAVRLAVFFPSEILANV